MLRNLFSGRTVVPNLVVAQRVLDKIAVTAPAFVDDETGEAMVGLVVPADEATGVPTVYVLDTIAPDESAIRAMHTFQSGDLRQDEVIYWLHQNWEVYRQQERGKKLLPKFDRPLQHLGDWHKQPGHMIAPSGGDLMTALDMLADRENSFDFLLAPIVTLGHPATIGSSEDVRVNFINLPDADDEYAHTRVDFWYIDRKSRMFLPIHPAVYPNEQLPAPVAYPWHLVNEDRYLAEIAQLEGDHLFARGLVWDFDGKLPLELAFMVARWRSDRVLLIGTPHDYPASPPVARVAPFMRMTDDEVLYDVFGRMWPQSTPVSPPPGFQWTPDTYLVDFVHAIEDAVGIQRSAPPAPTGSESEPSTASDTPESGEETTS